MSLLRQLLLSVTIAILVILAGSMVFSINSARQYLDTQLQSQSDSTATSLALTLSQKTNQDATVRELLISVLFDSGEFRVIEFLDPTGRIMIRRDMGEGISNDLLAPEWFNGFLPLDRHEAQREVSDGWSQLGVVRLVANDTYARNSLWNSTVRITALTVAAGILWGIFVIILMRWLRQALHDDVMSRVQAMTNDDENTELPPVRHPGIVELREVSQIITQTHKQVIATASERKAQIESLEIELNRDAVTGLANRKYFINGLRWFLESDEAGAKSNGHVMLFRQCDLQVINQTNSRQVVDQWLKSMGQLVLSVIRERIDDKAWLARLNGSDFAFVMPLVPGPEALRIAQAVDDVLQAQRLQLGKAGLCRWRMVLTDYSAADDIGDVMARLDEALMRAESAGHEDVEFLPSESLQGLSAGGAGEQVWRNLLRNALDQNWFSLDIQREISAVAPDGRSAATIMLQEPSATEPLTGYLFMPAAVRLGLSSACDIRAISLGLVWLRKHPGDLTMRVSLASILQEDFNGELTALLSSMPDQSARLVLELDSFAFVSHRKAIMSLARILKDYKVRLGLRRFAEQPEAILHLHELQPEYIKIANNLLAIQDSSPGARRLLDAIRQTAHEFGIVVDESAS